MKITIEATPKEISKTLNMVIGVVIDARKQRSQKLYDVATEHLQRVDDPADFINIASDEGEEAVIAEFERLGNVATAIKENDNGED